MIGILYNAIMHNMEFGQAYSKDFLKKNKKNLFCIFMKFILFILNFRNSSLNEFDLTKILEKGVQFNWAKTGHGFIHEFNIICLFSIYITFYYETKLIFTGLWKAKNYGDFYRP
jgi:hypothetical protein